MLLAYSFTIFVPWGISLLVTFIRLICPHVCLHSSLFARGYLYERLMYEQIRIHKNTIGTGTLI